MTLDEAIKHAREVANRDCTECNKQHEQLAEWLEELKIYKKALTLACDGISDRGCEMPVACCRNNCELYAPCCNEITWKEYFLNKATED